MKKSEIIGLVVVLALFLLMTWVASVYTEDIEELIESEGIGGIIIYTFVAIVATVIAPLSFLPLLPFAVALWGPFTAAVLSVVGWWVGAMIAFWIARKYGYPVVRRLLEIERIERIEKIIPPQNLFWSVVFFRVVLPVDLLSYALGLFTNMKTVPYALATLMGIIPFALLFSYLASIPVGLQATIFLVGVLFIIFGYRKTKERYFS